ncbi:DHA2 family efflux MFS transporter permease subunit [Chitinivorax sp. PXF-14]|uniref:DHA2 family efflux MFS transporter permease subunit n=1 Tax=Chitinivorax sp. PXF-14 TaxID=3230488 RepID=UPI0034655B1F
MSTATATPAAPAPIRGATLGLLTLSVAVATFMEVLDMSIANVSVPHIAGDLAVSPNQGTWVISSYGLASAIAVPLTGWMAKRFGEVRLFVTSVLLFTLMSLACGFATSLPMLVTFRLLQGLVSGPMVPLSQTLLLSNYPPHKKGLALALWAMTVVIAPIFGPLLGGWITDNMSWPWIFYINVPVGLLSAAVTWTLLKRHETPTVKLPIDAIGLALLVIGVGSLQYVLDNGNEHDWFGSTEILSLTVLSVVALTFLVIWELTEEHPIVDLRLFKRRNFRYGTLALSLGFFAFFGTTVLFPLWLQTVMGYTATWAGIATAPVGILAFLFSPIVGKNVNRVDLRLICSFAFVVFGITAFWYGSFNLDTPFQNLLWPRVIQGLAVACFFVPVNQIVLSGLNTQEIASAAGLATFFRTLAGSFATATLITTWDRRATLHHAQLTEQINAYNPAATDYLGKLQSLGLTQDAAYAQVERLINAQGFMIATSEVFWLIAAIFVALIVVVWLAKPPFGSVGGAGGH